VLSDLLTSAAALLDPLGVDHPCSTYTVFFEPKLSCSVSGFRILSLYFIRPACICRQSPVRFD
jgi:hypothetical protein